jgi:signal transduction histidine kinase
VTAALAVLSATVAFAQAPEPLNRRFLVVYEHDSTLIANIEIAAGIERALSATMPAGREMYSEHRDLARFPGVDHERMLAEAMAAKYAELPMDAVLMVGPGALDFVLRHREAFAAGAPVVFGGVSPEELARFDLPPDARGVVSSFDVRRTVALARDLQPGARRVVLVAGSAGFDQDWIARAQQELQDLDGLEVSVVTGLSLAGFEAMAQELDLGTILVVLSVFQDAEGRKFLPRDPAGAIAAAAGTPTYAVYNTYIGHGVLGGQVETFDDLGKAMGELAMRVLSGSPGVPTVVETPSRPLVDWRQMQRFGLNGEALPPDAERLYYQPNAWERYRGVILLASAVIVLQSGTIAALVVLNRRRRRLEGELAVERVELAHLSRATQVGELSGALAHELNQPLTAILANAEVASRLLQRDPPELGEIAEILDDIAADDRRAAGIITELRRLMTKGEVAQAPVDLARLVDATVALTRSEMVARQTRVEVRHDAPDLTVSGNAAQLQQVILNLVLNGADAMAEKPPADRVLSVETRVRDDGWRELAVRDRGRGISGAMREDAFKPFVTSKPQGLGFGLSICRSIVQSHGGSLAFDPAIADGARIVLALPRP